MIFSNTLSIPAARTTVTLCAFLATLGARSQPAHAGSWVLDGYQVMRNVKWDSQYWTSSSSFSNSSTPREQKTAFIPAYKDGSPITIYSDARGQFFNDRGTAAPFQQIHNKNILTVTPMFHWEASNANDKPPLSLWYWVTASVRASWTHTLRDGTKPYTPTNPYTPEKHFKLLEFNDGFDSIPPPLVVTPPSQPSGSVDATTYMLGERMEVVNTYGQKYVHGATRSLTCTLQSTPQAQASNKREEINASSFSSFVVRMISFRLAGRTKMQYPDSDLTSDFSFGGTSPNAISLAAGGLNDGIHRGDIAMQVTHSGHFPQDTYVVPGVPKKLLPRPAVAGKEGVYKHNWILEKSNNSTDAQGRIMLGTLYSRDLTTNPQNQSAVYLKPAPQIPGVGVNHSWAGMRWKLNSSDENANTQLEWNPRVFPNQTQEVICKPRFGNDLPLKGHKLRFYVSRVWVKEADPVTGVAVDHLYVIDAPRQGEANNPAVFSQDPKWLDQYKAISAHLAFFGAGNTGYDTVNDGGNGIYTAYLQIPSSLDWQVINVEVAVQDQGVYEKVSQ